LGLDQPPPPPQAGICHHTGNPMAKKEPTVLPAEEARDFCGYHNTEFQTIILGWEGRVQSYIFRFFKMGFMDMTP